MIDQTGELTNTYQDWRNKPEETKMWENLKLYFRRDNKDYKDEQSKAISQEYRTNFIITNYHISDLQHYINQVQEKANQDSTNF